MADLAARTAELEVNLVVRDLDAMTRFYQEGVGLRHLVDFRTATGLMRRFAAGDSAVFKLLRLDDPPTASNPPGGIPAATGLRHVAMTVDDVEAAFARCIAAGGTVVRPVQRYGDSGPLYGLLEDPEGTWVELVQREG
jgi:predicted enzyme related to lactoylglutathione lyase